MNDEKKHDDATDDVEGHAMFRPDEDEMFGDDTAGHAIATHPSRPGQGPDVGGKAQRFRPDEDEMFGDDVQGHGTGASGEPSPTTRPESPAGG